MKNALWLLLLAAGCIDVSGVKTACTANADCRSGETCCNGVCEPGGCGTAGGAAAGGSTAGGGGAAGGATAGGATAGGATAGGATAGGATAGGATAGGATAGGATAGGATAGGATAGGNPNPNCFPQTGAPVPPTRRRSHSAVYVPACNQVLITGGVDSSGIGMRSVDIYDPARREFYAGPALSVGRSDHISVALDDGRVMLIGGRELAVLTQRVDITRSGGWFRLADTNSPRIGGLAIAVDGGVSVIAGPAEASSAYAERYDPSGNTWTLTSGQAPLGRAAMLAFDGGVYVAGGHVQADGGRVANDLVFYDGATDRWASIASSMSFQRTEASLSGIGNGQLLLAGGRPNAGAPGGDTFFIDAATGASTPSTVLSGRRAMHSAVMLSTREHFLLGNDPTAGPPDAVERHVPGSSVAEPTLTRPYVFMTVTALPDDSILVCGDSPDGGAAELVFSDGGRLPF